MVEIIDPTDKFDDLRRKAEKLIEDQADLSSETSYNILDLIHELRIHQAELEIQNEELQRAQQEISDLHREYEDLYEFAPCAYLTLNHRGIITHINLTGSRLLDTERKFISRTAFSNFIAADRQADYLSARAKSAATGQKQSIELPLKTKKGPRLWVQAEIQMERNGAGELLQWRVVLLDINEKKKAAAALEKSEAKYRKMVESISDPLYVCSPERTIQYINPAMMKRLGRDATGEVCHTAIHGLAEPCRRCPFDKVRNGATIEEDLISPLDHRNYRVTHMPVLNEDQTVSKLTICRDTHDYLEAVAARQKAQAQLQQARKMESIGNLAGGIAHDFNNILASVIGFTELALDEVIPGTVLENNLQEVFMAANRAKDLVTQILTFARQTNEEIRPVQIADLITESLKLLRASIPTTIAIKQALHSESAVMGNATLIQQAIMNLATNAMHAMAEKGGVLTVQLEDVKIEQSVAEQHELLTAGDHIRMTVADTGTGIAPESLPLIFEPYFTTKALGRGTGMGLALVHGTVKKYGGAIMVDSRPGRGTEFTILLPVSKKRVKSDPYQPTASPRGTERILFVDDEPPIAKMAHQLLERLGYDVTVRTRSPDALALFQAKPDQFDLVITDLTMPDLTGRKLALALKKIRPDLPVILCTGYSNQITDATARENGIDAVAYKPIVKADLAKTVRSVLDAERSEPA